MQFFLIVVLVYILNRFIDKLEMFFYGNILLVKISLFLCIVSLFYFKKAFKYLYIVFLGIVLFLRDKGINGYSRPLYFKEWIKIIFKNKVVFVNVIGNILMFIPLGYMLDGKMFTLKSLLLVAAIEVAQYLLKIGIFDYIDMGLNLMGLIIGKIIEVLYEGRQRYRREDWRKNWEY